MIQREPCAVVVIRKRHNKLRKTVYKEILRAIRRLGLSKAEFDIKVSPMEIRYKKNGNIIYFTGSDNVDDTKGIIDEDRPIKLVVLDELTEFFEQGEGEDELQNIEATFIRGNDSGFQMLYLYNPPKNPNAEIVKWCRKMEQRPDCIHVHTDYRDVPIEWIGRNLVDAAEALRDIDERQYRWVWLGQSIGVDEAIYYMFCDKHIAPAQERYRFIGIGGDYGQQNATTFQAYGLDLDKRMVRGLGEYFHSGRDTGKQKAPSEYAKDFIGFCVELLEQFGTEATDIYLWLDPSAKGLKEEIKRETAATGMSIHVKDADNDVALGISRVQKLLTYQVMTTSPRQENAIREYGTYEYDKKSIEKGKEVPVKVDDHCMDAIRYFVMGTWKYTKKWLPIEEKNDESIYVL